MKFKFNVCEKIKEVWPIYKENFWTLFAMTIITIVVSVINSKDNWIITLLSYVVSILIFYVWVRLSFALTEKNKFNPFSKQALPTIEQFWNLFKTVILYTIIIFAGILLFVIPGLYLSGRLIFAPYISIEKNQGARKSIKESWEMTRGNGWRIFWKVLLIGLFVFVGVLIIFIGAFITYPIGIMLLVMLYHEFAKFKNDSPVEVVDKIPESSIKEEAKEI